LWTGFKHPLSFIIPVVFDIVDGFQTPSFFHHTGSIFFILFFERSPTCSVGEVWQSQVEYAFLKRCSCFELVAAPDRRRREEHSTLKFMQKSTPRPLAISFHFYLENGAKLRCWGLILAPLFFVHAPAPTSPRPRPRARPFSCPSPIPHPHARPRTSRLRPRDRMTGLHDRR